MPSVSPSVVLAAYAEALLDGRRVVVFGDATSPLAERLVDRGARTVHLYDLDRARAAEGVARNRSKQVTIAPLGDVEGGVREGAFDVALVENLAAHGDPNALLTRLRRLLSARGVAIVATPNPDVSSTAQKAAPASTVGYYDLYDAVSGTFEHVHMLGQAPFAGFAVVDFSNEGEPEVSIDTGFVAQGSEEPEWFVALASDRAVDVESYAIVQLPLAEARFDPAPAADASALPAARAELERERERVSALEAENARLRAAAEQADAARTAASRVEALSAELARKDAWIRELEARAAAADARADETLDELERKRGADDERVRAAERRVSELDAELAKRKAALDGLEAERAKLAEKVAALEAELAARAEQEAAVAGKLAEAEARLARLTAVEEVDDEHQKLEATLVERGAEIRRLTERLREAERLGREVVDELKIARSSQGTSVQARALSDQNARLEADLAAARWTIQELEGRLKDPEAPSEQPRKAAAPR